MSFDTGQLIINEDGVLTDRTNLIHDESTFNWTNTRGRRGTASVPLMILAGESYLPKVGWPVWIYEVYQGMPTTTEPVFVGSIEDFQFEYLNDAGDRIVTLAVTSLEQYFDTIQTPAATYSGMTAGQIFTAIFNAVIGQLPASPAITLGTVDAGVSISQRTYDGTSNAAADFQQLATDSAYIWYMDPRDQKAYFHAHDTRAASFTVVSEDIYVEAAKSSIKWGISRSDFRSVQVIQTTPNVVPGLQASFLGDGTTTDFALPSIASSVLGAYITTATAATSTATFIGQPSPGDTAVVHPSDRAPTFIYTFVSTLDNTVTFQVLIGATATDTAQNFADAINANPATRGIGYSAPSWANSNIQAGALAGSTFPVRSLSTGPSIVTLTATASNFTWSDSPLSGGASSGVVDLSVGIVGAGMFDLVYSPGTSSISVLTPIKTGVTLTVQYTSAASGQLGVGNNAATALGVNSQFRIFTAHGAPTAADAIQQSQGKLAAYSVLPKVFSFTSDHPGLYCGGYVTVLLTVPADAAVVLNGNWVVQEVQGDWIAGFELNAPPFACHFRYTYTLINTTEISTYKDVLATMIDTGPFEQPKPLEAPAAATNPDGSGVPDPGAGGGQNLRAGQDWVQEQLGLAIISSGNDLLMGSGTDVTSDTHTFTSGEVGSFIVIDASAGWTPGSYAIISVAGGVATLASAPATAGASGGLWGTADPTIYQFTWSPATSYWTGNQIAIVNKLTGNGDSPLTFTDIQLTAFPYAEVGYTLSPFDGNNGPDYIITHDQLMLREPIAAGDILLTEYFPDSPTKLPHKRPGDAPPGGHYVGIARLADTPDQLMYTNRLTSWTSVSSPVQNTGGLCITADGAGKFVALALDSAGTNRVAIVSTDRGVTWTEYSVPQHFEYVSVTYGLGTYVGLDFRGHVITSSDGMTWADAFTLPTGSSGNSNGWSAVEFCGGIFVAVGGNLDSGNPVVATSVDGTTWVTQTAPQECWGDVTFGAGTFVAVGGPGLPSGGVLGASVVMTSPDAVAWTSQTPAGPSTRGWKCVAYGAGLFVAAAVDFVGSIMTSPDGITWSIVSVPPAVNAFACRFLGGQFIICCENNLGFTIVTSPDAATWTLQSVPLSKCDDIAYNP